jgi:putative transposase
MHVTQRGVNRCAIFIDDQDRHHYRRLLREACRKHGVAVHAFVLMDNHVHLLLSANRVGQIALAMRASGQAHVQAFNFRHGRSGTLWQGRFKSCLVETDRYVLTVIRYIELNPVRAAMVVRPEDYRWSSVHSHLGRACDPLLTLHPLYLALGCDPSQRAKAYDAWLRAGVGDDDLADVRRHIAQERALGDARFQHMVERALNRPVSCGHEDDQGSR